MPLSEDRAWFRRRKYGIGWALHKSWQGWLLMLAYLFLAAAGLEVFEEKKPQVLSIYLVIVTACALWLCWWKGERSICRGESSDHDEKKNA